MEKDLRKAACSGYFSIDSILAAGTPIPCKVERIIPRFGFLVPELEVENLPPGTSINLPLFAAKSIWRGNRDQNFISVDIPSWYEEAVWEVANVDPVIADLSGYHPQFFEFSLQYFSTFVDKSKLDDNHEREALLESLKDRIVCIGDSIFPKSDKVKPFCPASTGLPISGPIHEVTFDSLEKKLFRDMNVEFAKWEKWVGSFFEAPKQTAHISDNDRMVVDMAEDFETQLPIMGGNEERQTQSPISKVTEKVKNLKETHGEEEIQFSLMFTEGNEVKTLSSIKEEPEEEETQFSFMFTEGNEVKTLSSIKEEPEEEETQLMKVDEEEKNLKSINDERDEAETQCCNMDEAEAETQMIYVPANLSLLDLCKDGDEDLST